MAVTSFSGPVLSTNGFQGGTEAAPVTIVDASGNLTAPSGSTITQGGLSAYAGGAVTHFIGTKTAIPDTTATALFTVNIPNASHSIVLNIFLRTAITAASHVNDSSRVLTQTVVITRQAAGIVAVAAISAVGGAQIATTAAGQTLTSTLAATQAGAAGAVNTVAITVANVVSVAGTSEAQYYVDVMSKTSGVSITIN